MADPVNDLRRLAGRGLAQARPVATRAISRAVRPWADRRLRALPPMGYAERRLYVGPSNTAGQGWEWARAAERHLPGTAAQALWAQRALGQQHFRYRADHELSVLEQRGRVREIHGRRVLGDATHVLFESGLPVLSRFYSGTMLDDVPALSERGIGTAVVYHGSDIRDLRAHAEAYPHSPFRGAWDAYFEELQQIVERNRAALADFDGAVLVSTPDLLDVSPRAVWLPLVVDVDRFVTPAPVLERERPVVLHAPSNARLKGGAGVAEQLRPLHERGLIDYRTLSGVAHEQMPAALAEADIVLDQFALGATGVFAAEAQAAGRVVVAHIAPHVRVAMAGPDGAEVPVVEAGPDQVGQVVQQVLADRDRYRALARSGLAWARDHHDGRRSAQVLEQTLLSS